MQILQRTIFGVNAALGVITLVAISLRLWRRVVIARNPRSRSLPKHLPWSDALLVLAGVCAIAMSILNCHVTRFGVGSRRPVHINDVNAIVYDRLLIAANILYTLGNMLVKHSLLLLYRCFTYQDDTSIRQMLNGAHVIVFAFSLGVIGYLVYATTPVAYLWTIMQTPKGPTESVIAFGRFYYASSALDMTINLFLYLIPVYLISRMQLKRSDRIGIRILFGLGTFTLLAASFRVVVMYYMGKTEHFYYWMGLYTIACSLEDSIAVWVASLTGTQSMAKLSIENFRKAVKAWKARDSVQQPPPEHNAVPDISNWSLEPELDETIGAVDNSAVQAPASAHTVATRHPSQDDIEMQPLSVLDPAIIEYIRTH